MGLLLPNQMGLGRLVYPFLLVKLKKREFRLLDCLGYLACAHNSWNAHSFIANQSANKFFTFHFTKSASLYSATVPTSAAMASTLITSSFCKSRHI